MKKTIALLLLSIYSFAQTGKPQAIDNLATPLFKGITLRKQVTPVTPTLGIRLANVGDRLITKDSLGVVKQYLISSDISGVYAPLANPTFTGTVSLPSTTSIGSVSSIELGYIDGVTSNIQTQLNTKFDASNTIFESPLTFVQLTNPSTGAITNSVGIPQSSAFGSGYLSSTDWSTFNLKAPTANPTFTTNATSPKFTVTGSGYIANGSDVAMGAGSTADIVTYNTSGRILFSTGGFVRAAITNAGNFGIGTIAPTSKFEVSGTSSIRYNDGGQADGKYLRSNSTGIASWASIALSEISGFGTGVATFLATPSSANLATALTDETGTGSVVFSESPTLTGTLTTSVIANTAGANLATSSGNVGIRTNVPISPLHVNGAGLFNGDLSVSKVDPNLNLVNTSTSTTLNIYGGAVAAYNFNNANGHWFGTQGAYRMKIMTSATSFMNNVGIGTESPNASSILDVISTNKGVLVPRLTTAQINAISSPADGLIVYNTDLKTICFYDGGAVLWKRVSHSNM